MNAIPLLFVLLANPAAPQPDRWFAEDKLQHFFSSFVATTVSATIARLAGMERQQSITVGVGAGLAAGFIKEIHDVRAGGRFSVRDAVWDVAGVGAAFVVLDAAR